MRSRRFVIPAVCLCVAVAAGGRLWRVRGAVVPSTTALSRAVRAGDADAVRELLEGGADPNQAFGGNRSNCLAVAVSRVSAARVVGRRGLQLWSFGPEDTRRREMIVELLLSHGANVNQANRHGRTPLFSAASTADVGLLKLLLAKGANPNVRDDKDKSPLQVLAEGFLGEQSRGEAVAVIVGAGGKINARDNNGRTALHAAAGSVTGLGNPDKAIVAAKALLDNGANVNAKDILGLTPLDMALEPEVAAFLRKAGGKGLGE